MPPGRRLRREQRHRLGLPQLPKELLRPRLPRLHGRLPLKASSASRRAGPATAAPLHHELLILRLRLPVPAFLKRAPRLRRPLEPERLGPQRLVRLLPQPRAPRLHQRLLHLRLRMLGHQHHLPRRPKLLVLPRLPLLLTGLPEPPRRPRTRRLTRRVPQALPRQLFERLLPLIPRMRPPPLLKRLMRPRLWLNLRRRLHCDAAPLASGLDASGSAPRAGRRRCRPLHKRRLGPRLRLLLERPRSPRPPMRLALPRLRLRQLLERHLPLCLWLRSLRPFERQLWPQLLCQPRGCKPAQRLGRSLLWWLWRSWWPAGWQHRPQALSGPAACQRLLRGAPRGTQRRWWRYGRTLRLMACRCCSGGHVPRGRIQRCWWRVCVCAARAL
mmetsp:Transcript_60899/g.189143  ORF Transcript_60899/g.189143 Transcript_60899/m.189143 type:complete len:385 (+) Transcript_60899:820-1974(+)